MGSCRRHSGSGCGVFLFNHVRQRVIVCRIPLRYMIKSEGDIRLHRDCSKQKPADGSVWDFGKGMPNIIPVVDKDFIFAAICEELGAIFAICMLLVCMSCYLMIVNVS